MRIEIDDLERRFVWLTVGTLVLAAVAIGYSVQEIDVHLPDNVGTVDPGEVARGEVAPFDQPGLTQIGENHYEAVIVSRAFAFDTGATMTVQDAATGNDTEIGVLRIPQGATVDFVATSQDVIHGMRILDSNVNVMLIPGEVTRATHTFEESGTLQLLCMEYCGIGHNKMYAEVIVE